MFISRRRRTSAGARYAPQSFLSGVQEITQFSFTLDGAQAKYTFTAPVTGGAGTQWSMQMNGGGSITPSDSFGFGYDGGNSASYYFVVDGSGSGSGNQVNITSSDSAQQVADAVMASGSVPGLSLIGSDTIGYTGSVYESQSSPSGGSYGSVQYINSGSADPGNVAALSFKYIASGSETGIYLWFAYSNGFDPGTFNGAANGVQVLLTGNYSETDLVNAAISAIASAGFNTSVIASMGSSNELYLTSSENGTAANGSIGSGSITLTQLSNGYGVVNFPSSPIMRLRNPQDNQTYQVWCSVNGSGANPGGADNSTEAALNAADSSGIVASAIAAIFGANFSASGGAGTVTVTAPIIGVPSSAPTSTNPPFTAAVHTAGLSNVDTTAETITKASHGFITGVSVRLTTTGTLPGGLSLATTYYLIKVDANTLAFATNFANAQAGTKINLTNAGSGTHTITQF